VEDGGIWLDAIGDHGINHTAQGRQQQEQRTGNSGILAGTYCCWLSY
jgi:hypothetical protein